MKLHQDVLANLPPDLEVTFSCTVRELLEALAKAGDVPEMASTVALSRAWGFSARQWREWAIEGLVPGAKKDEGGIWRLPREAAREQFERALGRDIPRSKSVSHLPRAHGPRKARQAGA
jgi:hypothetical protein